MYIQYYIVACSCKYCCHANTIICSLFFHKDVAVSNIKVFCVPMEMQQHFPFVLMWSYRMLHTAITQ